MPDRIQLLPDHIANQIAAGEVIQRPASAVKELMENAIDAGATEVKLIINDAGKSLVQVIDNGSGMGDIDARMCFERHATSKIRSIDDLFQIRTMGFRGEALASIAAVAQVELKSKREEDEAGVFIAIENSVVKVQEPVAHPRGTSFAMKNLFFNVPARRNFLKSNAAELRHIVDEFTRIALAFPSVFFSFTSNGQQLYHLEPGSLKQRIVQLMGSQLNAKLVAVREQTDYMNITGFVGKPETARKTRGEQYFFVNSRFIRSPYLHHAVMNAYQSLITSDSFPLYVLFIDLDPAQVDVNVHPTKQEIKFEDEKIVYAFVQAAVKHALAQFSVTPTLDFELDAAIQSLPSIQQPFTDKKQEAVLGSSIFRAFTQKHQAHLIERRMATPQQDLGSLAPAAAAGAGITARQVAEADLLQLLNTYIVVPTERRLLLVHQQYAHERVLFERLSEASREKPVATQRTMFPQSFELPLADAAIMEEILPELNTLGYHIEPFGQNAYLVQGTPADVEALNVRSQIELLLDQYKNFRADKSFSPREKVIRSLSRQSATRAGIPLTEREMKQLLADLFTCRQPNFSPQGQPVFVEFSAEHLASLFAK